MSNNKYMICSVSLIAFLNRTTLKAPTNPNDNTMDDFIMENIRNIDTENMIKKEEKIFLFEIDFPYLL